VVDYQIANRVTYSEEAKNELNDMITLTTSTLTDAIGALKNFDADLALMVISKEEQIDNMERQLRKNHIMRLNNRFCTGDAGVTFVDIVSNLERIGDHSVNIAEAVIEQDQINHIKSSV
jgi:phosphate:Na+ symporter